MKRLFHNLLIRQKLNLLMLLTSGMALLLAGGALVIYELATYRPRAIKALQAETNRVGYYAAPSMKFESAETAQRTLAVLEKYAEIRAAALYMPDGRLLAQFQQTSGDPYPLPHHAPTEGSRFVMGHLELTNIVSEDDQTLGSLLLVSDLGQVYRRLRQQAGIIGIAVLLSALVSYLLSARLQPLVAGSIQDLARTARHVSKNKDYTVRVHYVGRDEVGEFVRTFNEMLDTIQKHEAAGRQARDELEHQVQARTAELSRAYEALQASEKQIQAILDNAAAVIYLKKPDGTYVLVNALFEKLFHVRRDTITDKTDYELFPKDMADAFRKNDQTVLQTGKVLEIEEVAPQDDGPHTYLSVKFPLTHPDGSIYAVCGISTDITERKLAERELQESEQRFRRAVTFAPFPIMIHAEDGEVVMISESWTTLTGYTHAEISTTEDWSAKAYGERHQLVKKVIDDLYNIQAPVAEGEFEIQAKNGRAMTWSFSSAPLGRLRDGRRIVMSMAMDVTERKRAEESLRHSEELTRFWLNATTDGVWDWNLETDAVYLSSRFKEMFGYTDAEMENHAGAWHKIIHPDDLPLFLEAFQAHVETGTPFNVPIRHRHKSGTTVWVICRGVAIKNQYGRRYRMLGTLTDITRLKQIEDSLRQSENAFRQTVMNAPLPSVVHPDSGEISLANRAWVELSGYDVTETPTIQAWAEKTLGDAKDVFLSSFDEVRAIRGMGRVSEGEFHIRNKKSESRVWEFTSSKLGKLPDGRRLFITMGMDVTDRKHAEELLRAKSEELQRSNKELEQFAYIASHDLQEPLRTVSSFTQLLAQKARGKLDTDADEYMDFIVDGAKRAQRLINDLLQYSRVGTRGKPFVSVDCNEMLDEALANLHAAITESQAVINREPLPVITGDPTQLPQLFQNLISNAIKFRKPGQIPRIDVTANQTDTDFVFTIADNGIGIAPQFHDRIFAIFQRLHRREEYPGTGIGLAVCKRIVERHGGRLWVESEPDKGSRFIFTVPRHPPTKSNALPDERSVP